MGKHRDRTELPDASLERLRAALEASGLTATEVSRRAGIAEGHLRMILARDVRSPAAVTLAALARELGVSLDWLMHGNPAAPSETTPSAPPEAA